MVRRGSTVRVRQRALQKPSVMGFWFRIHLQFLECGTGMERFMEPSGQKRPAREPRRRTAERLEAARHNAEIGQPGLCFSAYGHKFGINHLVGLGANRRRAGRVDGARQYRQRENTMGMESRPNSRRSSMRSPSTRSTCSAWAGLRSGRARVTPSRRFVARSSSSQLWRPLWSLQVGAFSDSLQFSATQPA